MLKYITTKDSHPELSEAIDTHSTDEFLAEVKHYTFTHKLSTKMHPVEGYLLLRVRFWSLDSLSIHKIHIAMCLFLEF